MSIRSMTGFGQAQKAVGNQHIQIEIKSVNHRFKDFRFRLPYYLNVLEIPIREQIGVRCNRGSFDVNINVKKQNTGSISGNVDWGKVKEFLSALDKNLGGFKNDFNATDVLRNEFQVEQDENQEKELAAEVLTLIQEVLDGLDKSRSDEGKKLLSVMNDSLRLFSEYREKIAKKAPTYKNNIEEKLQKKIEEYVSQEKIDKPRMLQEVVYYLEKLDVDEELDRIKIHLKKVNEIMAGKGETGRQLEFILQELGRETNTIGSKCSDHEISQWVVQMKVCLEKIREQALNIE